LLAVAGAVSALAVAGAGTGSAGAAAGGNAVIDDCQSNLKLTHNYTLQELRHALAVMPASVKQYTSCYDVITQGILTVKAGKTTGPKGGGGSFLPTPVIIILVLLILAGVTFGAIAIRQRRASPGDGDPPESGPGPPESESPPGDEPPAA
jgi:hypothetical protein